MARKKDNYYIAGLVAIIVYLLLSYGQLIDLFFCAATFLQDIIEKPKGLYTSYILLIL